MPPTVAEREYAFARRFTLWSALAVTIALVATWIAISRPEMMVRLLCGAVVVSLFALAFGAYQMWEARSHY